MVYEVQEITGLLFNHSVTSNSFVTPWAAAHQAPLSMGFPRQEYWHGLLFPSSEDLPDPGIKPLSLALAGKFFATELPGKPTGNNTYKKTWDKM